MFLIHRFVFLKPPASSFYDVWYTSALSLDQHPSLPCWYLDLQTAVMIPYWRMVVMSYNINTARGRECVWNRLGAILRAQTWTGDRGNIWRHRLIYRGSRGGAAARSAPAAFIALGTEQRKQVYCSMSHKKEQVDLYLKEHLIEGLSKKPIK